MKTKIKGVLPACAMAAACLLAPESVQAQPVIVEQGFSTAVTEDNEPVDSITKGKFYGVTLHWIRWRNPELGVDRKDTCRIFAPGVAEPILDEDYVGKQKKTQSVSFCYVTTMSGMPEGTYRFVHLLNDKTVAEAEIEIRKTFIERLGTSLWIVGALALALLGWFVLRKRSE